jgi:hypothetical protein
LTPANPDNLYLGAKGKRAHGFECIWAYIYWERDSQETPFKYGVGFDLWPANRDKFGAAMDAAVEIQRIRNYGLLGNRHRAANLARCRELLAMPAPIPPPERNYRERWQQLTGHDPLQCPQCHNGKMVRIAILPVGGFGACEKLPTPTPQN